MANSSLSPSLLTYSRSSPASSVSLRREQELKRTVGTWTVRLCTKKLVNVSMTILNRQGEKRNSLKSCALLRRRGLQRVVSLPPTYLKRMKTSMPIPLRTIRRQKRSWKKTSPKKMVVSWKAWRPPPTTTNAPCSRLPCASANTLSTKKKYQYSILNCHPRFTPANG